MSMSHAPSTATSAPSVSASTLSNPSASTCTLPLAPPQDAQCKESIFELVLADHRYVEALYKCYCNTIDLAEKRRIANIIIKELSVHAVAEELSWYNLLIQKLSVTGNKLRTHAMEEHLEVKKALEKLDSMEIIDKEFDKQLQTVMSSNQHHVEEEEQNVIPPFESHLTEEEKKQLKLDWFDAKSKAPTRPHSWVPSTGGMVQQVGGAILKPFDKMKDQSRFSQKENEQPKSETGL